MNSHFDLLLAAVICLAVYFLLQFQVFGLLGIYRSLLQRLALADLVVSFVFIVTKTIESIVTKRSQAKKLSYKNEKAGLACTHIPRWICGQIKRELDDFDAGEENLQFVCSQLVVVILATHVKTSHSL